MSRGNRNTIGTGSVAPVSGAGATRANRNAHPDASSLASADESERKDLPSVNSPNFLEKLREAVSVYMGKRGDPLDRGITVRDLDTAGLITVTDGYLSNPDSFNPIGSIGGSVQAPYTPDLSPPPTPTGFTATGAISDFIVEHDSPAYVAGNGHGRTNLYGATWVSGALPVFSDATKLTSFVGTITSYPTDPATTWRLWIKWESKDGVESVTPAGGVNGLAVTTAQDPSKLLAALNAQITASQLHATLGERIDLIDGIGVGSVNARLGDEAITRADAITSEATTRSEQIGLEARTRGAQIQGNAEAALRNAIAVDNASKATATNLATAKTELTTNFTAGISAEAALRTALEANITGQNTATNSRIDSEAVARAAADSAETTARLTLAATVATNLSTSLAAVSTESAARVTADSAEATTRALLATQILGADGTALSQGLIYDERTTRVAQDNALAQQITLLSAGAGEQFDWQTIWYFDSGIESWAGNGTPTASAGWLRAANQASGAYAESPAGVAADSAKYGQVRMRIRKTGTPTFAGWLYWQATTDSIWDVARRIALTAPTYDSNGIGLITASPVWSGTINKVRVDLSSAQTVTDYFELDWVAIGRPSPGASSAQLLTEQLARAAADSAMASDITTLQATVNDPSTGVVATAATLATEQTTRASADTANASSITALSAQVNDSTTGLPQAHALIVAEQTARADADSAEASARTTLAVRVTTAEGNITTNASAISTEATTRADADTTNANAVTALSSQVNDPGTGLPQTRADLVSTQATLASATAASVSDSRLLKVQSKVIDEATLRNALAIDNTNTAFKGTLAVAKQELTVNLNEGISAEASARLALAALVDANSAAITAEQSARATADSAESVARTELAATVALNTAAITAEQSARSTADDAEAMARTALAARVTTTEGGITTNAAAIVSEASARATAVGAVASDVSTLSTTVGDHTSSISTQQTSINGLAAQYTVKLDVDGKVSGFGIAADATEGSQFLIRADRIAFGAPIGGTATEVYPFVVDTITNTVAIDGATLKTATIGNAAIQDAAIDNAKIANLSAAKITAGDLQVGEYIQSSVSADYGSGMEPSWSINGSGEVVFNQAIVRGTVYATDGVFSGEVIAQGAGLDMARMYYGNFEVYKSVPGVGQVLYKALSRVEFGVCVNAATVTIPGYFKSQPKIIVSPNSMQLYTPAYASQNQSINVSATAPVETSTGSMVWQFTPTAQLVLASGSSSTVINQTSGLVSSNSWTSSTYTTVANTSSITPSVTIASNRGNGASQYFYRTVRWRVEYWNGSAWITSGAFTTVNLAADTAASGTSTATFAFPSPGAWQFRIYAETYDTSTAVFGSVSYTPGSATITHSGASSHTTYSTAGGSVSYTHTYNNGTYTPTAPWQLDPVNTYSTVYTYNYQVSGGSGFSNGQGRVTDPNGQSFDTGVTRTNITLSNTVTKTKVSNTDANLSWTLFADGWTGSSAAGSAFVNSTSAVTTVKLRAPTANSATPSNNFTFGSYGYSLSTATVLATGSLNWIAIGD